jgi:hypothetical protein
VGKKLARRPEGLAGLHRGAKPVERFERRRAGTHHHPGVDEDRDRRRRGRLEREKLHVIENRQQGAVARFDARRRADAEQIVKIARQVQVLGQPALRGRVGQAEVQPQKTLRTPDIGDLRRGLVGGDRSASCSRAERVGADKTRFVRSIGHVADVHAVTGTH